MIIETSCNRLYRVTETLKEQLAHVWWGVEVKVVKGEFVPKKNARPTLVRKEATRIITRSA